MLARVEPMPSDRFHQVRRGDTLTSIARRYGVSEGEIAAANRLTSRNVIGIGQRLRLPGAPEPAPVAPPAQEPVVVAAAAEAAPLEAVPVAAASAPSAPAPTPQPAETVPAASEPAAPPPAASATAAPTNGSEPSAPAGEAAQPVEAPDPAPPGAPAPASQTPATVAALASEPPAAPSPDPSNYSVSKGDSVTIQAGETLGHYAEWLEVRASSLRRLNRMKPGAAMVIGHAAKLDFSRVTPEVFEARRLRYHLSIQEAFFEAYVVSGTETHTLARGETLWYLANKKLRVPEWLLRQYNPDLDFGALRAGTQMVVPVVEPRES